LYRIRIGDYRVIYSVDKGLRQVIVHYVMSMRPINLMDMAIASPLQCHSRTTSPISLASYPSNSATTLRNLSP
jgi:hypothetical protein